MVSSGLMNPTSPCRPRSCGTPPARALLIGPQLAAHCSTRRRVCWAWRLITTTPFARLRNTVAVARSVVRTLLVCRSSRDAHNLDAGTSPKRSLHKLCRCNLGTLLALTLHGGGHAVSEPLWKFDGLSLCPLGDTLVGVFGAPEQDCRR